MVIREAGVLFRGFNLVHVKYHETKEGIDKDIRSALITAIIDFVESAFSSDIVKYIGGDKYTIAFTDDKINSIESHVERGKQVLLLIGAPPIEWTGDDILKVFNHYTWKDKKKGIKYSPGYRNLIRGTIKKMLVFVDNTILLNQIDDEKNHRLVTEDAELSFCFNPKRARKQSRDIFRRADRTSNQSGIDQD